MQFAHGHGPVAGEYFRQDVQGEVDALVEQFLFAAWRASEHVAGNQAGVPRVADAEPQAQEDWGRRLAPLLKTALARAPD